jgi:hypothetical protein
MFVAIIMGFILALRLIGADEIHLVQTLLTWQVRFQPIPVLDSVISRLSNYSCLIDAHKSIFLTPSILTELESFSFCQVIPEYDFPL